MTHEKKPLELEYSDYRESVEMYGEDILTGLEEYPEDYENLHEAVWEAVDGSKLVTHNGYRLVTILLSDQHPDSPDYCEPWTTYVDMSDPTSADVESAMAYVCLYSDVYEWVERNREGE